MQSIDQLHARLGQKARLGTVQRSHWCVKRQGVSVGSTFLLWFASGYLYSIFFVEKHLEREIAPKCVGELIDKCIESGMAYGLALGPKTML